MDPVTPPKVQMQGAAPLTARHKIALLAVVVVGLSLRLWGIGWGYPRVDLNPDELQVLEVTSGISFAHLDPRFYSYSGLTFHLNFFAGKLVGLFSGGLEAFDQLLIDRLWSVLWGTLTILAVYGAARELLGSRRAGLIAAAAMALTPIHIWNSHFGTSDIGLTFWTTLAFYLAVRAYREPTASRFFLGGLAVGFAIGVKFNGALAGASFIAAAAVIGEGRTDSWKKTSTDLVVAGLASMLGFAISSPYSLLNRSATIAAFQFESSHVEAGHFGYDLAASGWQYHRFVYELFAALPFDLGFALYAASLIGLLYFVLKMNPGRIAVGTSFRLLYFAVFGSYTFVPIRYYLPILPILVIISSLLLSDWTRKKSLFGRGAVAAVFVYTAAFAVTSTHRFTQPTRLEAAAWADANLEPGAVVVYVHPIFGQSYVPAIDPEKFLVRSAPITNLRRIIETLEAVPDSYVVLSSLTYNRFYRQGNAEMIERWDSIRRNSRDFRILATFDGWYLNKSWYTALDPMFDGYFISPTVEIYRYAGYRRPENR